MNAHLAAEAAAPLTHAELARLGRSVNRAERDGECIMPVPTDAPSMPAYHELGRVADHIFAYRGYDGALLGYVLRWNARDGARKKFSPVTFWRDDDGNGRWRRKAWPGARPLFGLDRLAACPDAAVLLVEGEKKVDAVEHGPLADAFKWAKQPVIGIAWPGGAEAVEHADFAPLAGREVIILPDADDPGERAAGKAVDALHKIGARRVRRWKAPAGAPGGWDIADPVPAGIDPAALVRSILGAAEIKPPRIVMTLAEFLAGFTPPDYLVDGIFQRGYFYSITAMTGAGKTAVALLLSALIADPAGGKKFGPHAVEHGRVVYVARENSDDVRARAIGIANRMGFDPEALQFLVIEQLEDLDKDFPRIAKEIEAFGEVALVVLDTSAAMFTGDDENSNPQMLAHAKKQRKFCTLPGRPTVIALCHPTKSVPTPEQLLPRGGGSYLNETDGNATLWAHGDRLTDMHWTGKFRGPDFEKITFRLPTVHTTGLIDSKGRLLPTVMAEVVTDADIVEAENKAEFQENRLLVAILDRPNNSMADWASDCGWNLPAKPGEQPRPNKALVQRVIQRLQAGKFIAKSGRNYSLTKPGKQAAEVAKAAGKAPLRA